MAFLITLSRETWALIFVLLFLLMVYGIAPYNFFRRLGIPGPRPWPFIGTLLEYRKGFFTFDTECFQRYGKIWGFYDGRQPVLAVMDMGIIKTILVKECYSIFTNRRNFRINGPMNEALTVVEDEKWRRIRSVLSPTFTSGRLREMFPIIKHHGAVLVRNLGQKAEANQVVDMKQIFGAYSIDVVTSTSFSVNIDSLNNPQDPFFTNIKKMLKFSLFNPLLILLILFPFLTPLMEKLDISFFPRDLADFFIGSIRKIKENRQKNVHGSHRVDFLQLMVDSQDSEGASAPQDHEEQQQPHKALTDSEILAQAMVFILAGYETTSNSLSFVAYNLATCPECMHRLQQEIDQVLPNRAPVTYEALRCMDYLDMVLNESLRLYPAAGRLERVCKKTIEINGVSIPQGTTVTVPVFALHQDPELWPEPEQFNPERFSKENKERLDPYSYLPFGAGPRNCIGMRFAMLSMKAALVQILQEFTFSPCSETQIPPELSITGLLQTKKPIVLRVTPRATAHHEEGMWEPVT